MSKRLIQDLQAAISRRDWCAVETSANRLRDDVEKTIAILAGTGIGSLPNDYPLSKLAESALLPSPNASEIERQDGEETIEAAAMAAFRQAQSIYRADHDHFPLKSNWQTTDESVREGWRRIATAALSEGNLNASKLNENDIANALAPFFEEGWTARDGARAVLLLLIGHSKTEGK